MQDPRVELGLEVLGPALGQGSVTVVAIHGRDQDPGWLADALVRRIDDPGVTWLLPVAPGGRWYPGTFRDPPSLNGPALERSLEGLGELGSLLTGVDPRTVIWAGFSQGGCMACEHVATSPTRWGGLLAFTGVRLGSDGADLSVGIDLGGMPVYLGAGERDPWVSVERVMATSAAFEAAGARVLVDVFADDGDHHIRDAEIDRARRSIAEVRSAATR